MQSICNLKCSVPKEFLIVFHNGSNYDYHFIIKELTADFKKQFTCLGESTEKYITFAVLIKKWVTRIDKNREEITENICYRLQFIDSKILNFLNKFMELNTNKDVMIKNVTLAKLNISIVAVFLNT